MRSPLSACLACQAPLVPAPAARPLRVAFVTETYPPEVNGVATTTARFVDGLRRRQHCVQVVRPRQPVDGDRDADGNAVAKRDGHALADARAAAAPPDILVRGLPIVRYPHLRMGLPAGGALARLWALQRPDVVHVATEGPLGWSALQAARRLGLPVTSDFRTNFHAYSSHYGIGWLQRPILGYLRAFHHRCHVTMVPTDGLRQELQRAGFERLAVVPRGVDTAAFGPRHRSPALRAAWGAAPDDVVVCHVGRLAAEKNLGVLMAAFAAIRAVQPAARLVMVGDGPQRAALQARHPHVVFAGQRRGDDLAAHFASCDLFLFPSLTETFGNVTVEAMASGLPVLAFDHAAAGQLIHPGHDGVLATPGDGAQFAALAVALAGDAAWRQAMGRQARVQALGLGWDVVVAGFEARLLAACAPAIGARPQAAPRAQQRMA